MKMKEEIENLYKEMVKVSGDDLASKIMDLFEGHKELAVFWFYKPKFSLGNRSPEQYCKDGNKGEVEKLVGRLEHGVLP